MVQFADRGFAFIGMIEPVVLLNGFPTELVQDNNSALSGPNHLGPIGELPNVTILIGS